MPPTLQGGARTELRFLQSALIASRTATSRDLIIARQFVFASQTFFQEDKGMLRVKKSGRPIETVLNVFNYVVCLHSVYETRA